MHYKNIEGSDYYWSGECVTPSRNSCQEDKLLNSEESWAKDLQIEINAILMDQRSQ